MTTHQTHPDGASDLPNIHTTSYGSRIGMRLSNAAHAWYMAVSSHARRNRADPKGTSHSSPTRMSRPSLAGKQPPRTGPQSSSRDVARRSERQSWRVEQAFWLRI